MGRQQRRLACIDVIPDLARDVSTLKQDMVDIKQDVKDIKQDIKDIKDMLAAKPWHRFYTACTQWLYLDYLWIVI